MDNIDKCGIYCITNVVDGKRYIGQTIRTFKERSNEHKRDLINGNHYNDYLQLSYNKYGGHSFTFEILEICETLDQCNEAEEFWIYTFRTLNRKYGYNLKSGGSKGRLSPESIIKMSKSLTGKKLSQETKDKIREIMIGRIVSIQTKQRMSIAQSGENNAMFGRKATAQTKQKMSKVRLGIPKPAETKLKMSLGQMGEKNHEFGKRKPKEIKDRMSYNAIGKKKNSTSGYIGVYCHSNTGKWIAQVTINRKRKSLGYFTDKIQAAKAYDKASYEAYGRLDILNFPEDYQSIAI